MAGDGPEVPQGAPRMLATRRTRPPFACQVEQQSRVFEKFVSCVVQERADGSTDRLLRAARPTGGPTDIAALMCASAMVKSKP